MPNVLKELFSSKKFIVALAGVIAVVIVEFVPALDEVNLAPLIAVILTYIVGQGLADFGKSRTKIETEAYIAQNGPEE